MEKNLHVAGKFRESLRRCHRNSVHAKYRLDFFGAFKVYNGAVEGEFGSFYREGKGICNLVEFFLAGGFEGGFKTARACGRERKLLKQRSGVFAVYGYRSLGRVGLALFRLRETLRMRGDIPKRFYAPVCVEVCEFDGCRPEGELSAVDFKVSELLGAEACGSECRQNG